MIFWNIRKTSFIFPEYFCFMFPMRVEKVSKVVTKRKCSFLVHLHCLARNWWIISCTAEQQQQAGEWVECRCPPSELCLGLPLSRPSAVPAVFPVRLKGSTSIIPDSGPSTGNCRNISRSDWLIDLDGEYTLLLVFFRPSDTRDFVLWMWRRRSDD